MASGVHLNLSTLQNLLLQFYCMDLIWQCCCFQFCAVPKFFFLSSSDWQWQCTFGCSLAPAKINARTWDHCWEPLCPIYTSPIISRAKPSFSCILHIPAFLNWNGVTWAPRNLSYGLIITNLGLNTGPDLGIGTEITFQARICCWHKSVHFLWSATNLHQLGNWPTAFLGVTAGLYHCKKEAIEPADPIPQNMLGCADLGFGSADYRK